MNHFDSIFDDYLKKEITEFSSLIQKESINSAKRIMNMNKNNYESSVVAQLAILRELARVQGVVGFNVPKKVWITIDRVREDQIISST